MTIGLQPLIGTVFLTRVGGGRDLTDHQPGTFGGDNVFLISAPASFSLLIRQRYRFGFLGPCPGVISRWPRPTSSANALRTERLVMPVRFASRSCPGQASRVPRLICWPMVYSAEPEMRWTEGEGQMSEPTARREYRCLGTARALPSACNLGYPTFK
jgi:hypothetical protein